jgi:hypothetical protein
MADDNLLEIIVKATTEAFDKSVDKSKSKLTELAHEGKKTSESLKEGIDGIEKAGKSLTGIFSEMVEAFAGGRIIEFFKGFVEAASDAQARIASMDQTLEAMGNTTEGASEKLNEFAENLAKASGYALPTLVDGMTRLISTGASVQQAMYASTLAANIAARTHKDLGTVQMSLSRAIISGSLSSLTRLGVGIAGVNLRTVDLDVGLKKLGDNFAGAAAEHANTYEGALNRLKIAIEELKAGFGKDLLGPLTDFVNRLNWMTAAFAAISPEARRLTEILAGLVGGFTALSLILPLVLSMGTALATIFSAETLAFFISPLGLVIAGFIALGAAIYEAATHWKEFILIVGSARNYIEAFGISIQIAFFSALQAAQKFFAAVVAWARPIVDALQPFIHAIEYIALAFAGMVVTVSQLLAWLVTNLIAAAKAWFESWAGMLGPLVAVIKSAIENIVLIWGDAFAKLKAYIEDLIFAFAPLLSAINTVSTAFSKLVAQVAASSPMVAASMAIWKAMHDKGAGAVGDAVNGTGTMTGTGGAPLGGAQGPNSLQIALANIEKNSKAMWASLEAGAKKAGQSIEDYFKKLTTMGKIDVAKMPVEADPGGFDALGNRQRKTKKTKDTTSKDESNRISALKDLLADQLDPSKGAVDELKAALDKLKAAEDTLSAQIVDGKVSLDQYRTSLEQNTTEGNLHLGTQMKLTSEISAEHTALGEMEAERNRIAGNPKLASQTRELDGLIRSHTASIRNLQVAVEQAGAAYAKTLQERLTKERDYAAQLTKIKEDSAKQSELIAQREVLAVERALLLEKRARDDAATKAAQQSSIKDAIAAGPGNPWVQGNPLTKSQGEVDSTLISAQNAQADLNAAEKLRAMAAAAVVAATANVHYGESSALLTMHLAKLQAATDALTAEDDKLHAAEQAKAAADTVASTAQINHANIVKQLATPALTQLGAKLIAAVPELQQFLTIIQNSASPMEALSNIFVMLFQNTQSFKDLILIVQNIFTILARVLDAIFLPIIKALAAVLTDVVNVFIFLYNVVAMLLDVFGLHVTKLKYINSLLDQLSGTAIRPLLDTVHDLPTAKEYGAGKWGPLTSDATSVTGGLVGAMNANTAAQGGVLAAILKLIAVMALIGLLFPNSAIGGFIDKFFSNALNAVKKFATDVFNALSSAWSGLPQWAQGLAEIAAGLLLVNSRTPGFIGFLEKLAGWLLILDGILKQFGTSIIGVIGSIERWLNNRNPFAGIGQGSSTLPGSGGAAGGFAGAAAGDFGTWGGAGGDGFSGAAQGDFGTWGGASGDSNSAFGGMFTPANWGPNRAAGPGQSFGGTQVAFGNSSVTDTGFSDGSGQAGTGDFGTWGGGTASKGLNFGAAGMGAGLGALFGTVLGGLMGGGSHTQIGEAGGMLGGAVGGLLGGPAGALLGAGLGSLLGIFGHKDNPADMPDKYDTQRFTTMVGELQGSAGTAYGPAYNSSTDPVQQSLGGQPMLAAIQEWVAANENSTNPQLKALATQLKSVWGDTSRGLSFQKAIVNEGVIGGSMTGTYISIWNAATAAIQQIANTVGAVEQAATAASASSSYGGNQSATPSSTGSMRHLLSITQNNNVGTLNATALNQYDQVMGQRLSILSRTQRYAS